MPQRETALVGKNNVRALVTGQEELLVKVNSFGSAVGVDIKNPLGQQAMGDSVSTVLAYDQANVMITPQFKKYTNVVGDTSGITILSISFASVGTANALVSVDGGLNYENLAPGETLNLDAGGIMNFYNGNNFFWDTATNAGSSLIVAFNYFQ
jgi:hypothetical protein